MKRCLIRVVGGISLLLLAGTLWMWGRSYWFDDQVQRTEVGTTSTSEGKANLDKLLWIGSSRGELAVMTVRSTMYLTRAEGAPVVQWWWSEDRTNLTSVEQMFPNWSRILGIGLGCKKHLSSVGGGSNPINLLNYSSRCVIVPWGYVAGIFLVVPLWWGYEAVKEKGKERRLLRGLCAHCGYDLRGAGGICPECGKGKKKEEVGGVKWEDLKGAGSKRITDYD